MLSQLEVMVLMTVGYFQPVTRGELSKIFGKEVSRDTIGNLQGAGFIASGQRSPAPGAPYTYVTTQHFLSVFGMETLNDLPNIEMLEDAGLLHRVSVQAEPGFFETCGGRIKPLQWWRVFLFQIDVILCAGTISHGLLVDKMRHLLGQTLPRLLRNFDRRVC